MLTSSHAADLTKPAPRHPYSANQYLKNYALSVCLANGLPDKESQQEALAAAGGYLELGSYGIDAYQAAAQLAQQFLAKTYQAKEGGQLTVMKCIDLFHSKELAQLARKYADR